MPYGTIKIDTITFTDGGVDKSVPVSGLILNPTFTGNVTVTGTISGNIIQGGTTVSGLTVTGTTANFASGVFTTQISGVTITGTTVSTTTGNFTSLTGTTATITSGIIASGTAALPSLAILSDPNTGIYSPGADQLAVATNGTGRLFVDASGNIGTAAAGTTALANQRLLLTGTNEGSVFYGLYAHNNSFAAAGSARISLSPQYSFAYNTAPYIQSISESTTAAAIAIGTTSGGTVSERLRITSAGLVGIGSSSPSAKLDVEALNFAGGPVIGVRFNTSNVRLGFNVANSNGFAYIGSNTNNKLSSDSATYDLTGQAASQLRLDGGQLIFNNAPSGTAGNDITFTNRLTITSAGLVGIGSTSPSSALEVYATAPVLTVNSAVANASSIVLQQNGTTYARFRFDGNNVDIGNLYVGGATIFNAGNAERARIDSSGRLLVGTSTARSNINHRGSVGITPNVQFETATASYSGGLSIINNSTTGNAATLTLGTSKGGGIGSNTIVGDNEQTGTISFSASDGTNFIDCAQVRAEVDGTPGANDMPGRLVFSTTADGGSSPTERMRITSTGQVRLAGAGITFNGDTAAANELDDYEEGTWTPSVGGTATYSDQNGTYTKIGRTVTINFSLNITLLGTGSNNTISGLPFYVGSAGYGATGYFSGLAINVIGLTCNVTGTTVLFNSINASGSTATNNPAILGNSCLIQGSATYFV